MPRWGPSDARAFSSQPELNKECVTILADSHGGNRRRYVTKNSGLASISPAFGTVSAHGMRLLAFHCRRVAFLHEVLLLLLLLLLHYQATYEEPQVTQA